MKKIKKIAKIHLVAEAQGEGISLLVKIVLLAFAFFVFFGFLGMLSSLSKGLTSDFVMGLTGITFFGIGLWLYYCKGGNYVPQKTFFLYRLTKERLKNFYIGSLVICIVICGLILMIDPRKFLQCVGPLISFIFIVYYMNKSIQIHDDVDYVANAQFADLMGLEVDEKINASYQNFNSSENSIIKKNSNILLVSDRKIFFAYFNGYKWVSTIKKLEEIEKIGFISAGGHGTVTYWKVIFYDGTKIGLRLSLLDKLTSNPNLFIKQFLETIDAYLLGYSKNKRNSRRRVSLDNTSPMNHDTEQPHRSKNISTETPVTREIDISESILNDIKQGIVIEPGRSIEL